MDELSRLFNEYRAALPDPEPSANFTPELWKRIDARRSSVLFFRRIAATLVTATAVITLLIATIVIPRLQQLPVYSATYVDVLAAEHSSDSALSEMLRAEVGAEAPPK